MKSSNVRLNSHQKTVLAIVAYAPTAKVAAEDIVKNANLRQAAQTLATLGALAYDDAAATITQVGSELSVDENITDELGELTTNGQMYLKVFQQNTPQVEAEPVVTESLLADLLRQSR